MPKKASALTFEQEPIIDAAALEFMTHRIEELTSLLARMVETTGEITGNGTHAKDRCYDCAKRSNHYTSDGIRRCDCVCHDARDYLTSLANER